MDIDISMYGVKVIVLNAKRLLGVPRRNIYPKDMEGVVLSVSPRSYSAESCIEQGNLRGVFDTRLTPSKLLVRWSNDTRSKLFTNTIAIRDFGRLPGLDSIWSKAHYIIDRTPSKQLNPVTKKCKINSIFNDLINYGEVTDFKSYELKTIGKFSGTTRRKLDVEKTGLRKAAKLQNPYKQFAEAANKELTTVSYNGYNTQQPKTVKGFFTEPFEFKDVELNKSMKSLEDAMNNKPHAILETNEVKENKASWYINPDNSPRYISTIKWDSYNTNCSTS